MERDEVFKRPEPVFAPLIGRHVECDTLQVSRFNGKNLEPAFDEDGQPIELLVDEDMPELIRRICEPGRYRVAARDPHTKQYITFKDFLLRPRLKQATPPAARSEGSDSNYLNHLRDSLSELREQMREQQARAERDILYERERATEALRAAREQIDAATRKAHEAEVKMASYSARLEARDQRLGDLEEQVAEMKAEIENARELAAELKKKAEQSEFSPLDALMQMDQALDVIGKTAERFAKPK
jgi:hypothetical protein